MGWRHHAEVRKGLAEFSQIRSDLKIVKRFLAKELENFEEKNPYQRVECGREEEKCCEVILVTSQVVLFVLLIVTVIFSFYSFRFRVQLRTTKLLIWEST